MAKPEGNLRKPLSVFNAPSLDTDFSDFIDSSISSGGAADFEKFEISK